MHINVDITKTQNGKFVVSARDFKGNSCVEMMPDLNFVGYPVYKLMMDLIEDKGYELEVL